MDLSINEGTLVVSGGPGDSPSNAITIKKTPKGLSASGAEHMVLTQRYGQRGTGWTLIRQDLLQSNGRTHDVFTLELQDRSQRTIYFDVTELLAKANERFL
jgi:hypothetical protein